MLQYKFTPQAFKHLKKLPKDIQKRILKKLDFYSKQKDPLVFADFLIDSRLGRYRYRVGDYRIIFDLDNDQLIILTLGHRREIYRVS